MIASMQGNAVGFGFELALQCDVRLAADDCVVALPEARVGMLPAGGASQTLPRVVGTSAALAAVITGERVPAADALARGFVDEVVPRARAARAHRRAGRRGSRRVRPRRCAPPRRRCGRRSTSRSRSGCGARPTSPRRLPVLRRVASGPCPRSRESSVRSRPVATPRSTTSSAGGCSGRCRAASTSSVSRAGERRNGMTINWVTQLSFDPKLVGVSVEREAFTHELVADGGVFSVNLVAQDDRAIVRKFTKPVEVDLDARTLNGFPFHDGATGAPILDQAVAYLDCEVRQIRRARRPHPLPRRDRRLRLPARRGHAGARRCMTRA